MQKKKLKRAISFQDLNKWVLDALTKNQEDLDSAPSQYKQGEGVQDVDPNDDVYETLPEDKPDESK